MSSSFEGHLNYDQLLMAVVEIDDLPDELKDHLEDCPRCRAQLQRTTARLESIGRIAARLAPEPSRTIRVHARRRVRRPSPGRMKSFMAIAVVAMLVVFVSIWSKQFFGLSGSRFTDGEQIGQLIMDVNRLVENPLPEGYSNLVKVDEPMPLEDPTAFIVPDVDNSKGSEPLDRERIVG